MSVEAIVPKCLLGIYREGDTRFVAMPAPSSGEWRARDEASFFAVSENCIRETEDGRLAVLLERDKVTLYNASLLRFCNRDDFAETGSYFPARSELRSEDVAKRFAACDDEHALFSARTADEKSFFLHHIKTPARFFEGPLRSDPTLTGVFVPGGELLYVPTARVNRGNHVNRWGDGKFELVLPVGMTLPLRPGKRVATDDLQLMYDRAEGRDFYARKPQ